MSDQNSCSHPSSSNRLKRSFASGPLTIVLDPITLPAMIKYLCSHPDCERLLMAYHTLQSGHPVDEDGGYLFVDNIAVHERWEIHCEAGHELGSIETEDEESHEVISVSNLEWWLRGYLESASQPVDVRITCGAVTAVLRSGVPIQFGTREEGPSLWGNCESCEELVPADNLNEDPSGDWLCFSCFGDA